MGELMKNMLRVVPVVILAITLLCLGIYFNQNQRTTSQEEFNKSANKEPATTDVGSKSNQSEVPSSVVPVDPNQMLPSSYTLSQVKQKIDGFKAQLVSAGRYSQDEINTTLEKIAKDYGTTMDAVNKCGTAPVATVTQPSTSTTQPSAQSTTKPSTPTTKPSTPTTKPSTPTTKPSSGQQSNQGGTVTQPSSGPTDESDAGGHIGKYDPAKSADPNFHMNSN